MSVTQLTQKGQILVPKHLRRKLGLKPGGKVHLAEEEGRLVLTPVPPDPIQAATGFLKGRFSLTQDLRREHRERRAVSEKLVLDSFAHDLDSFHNVPPKSYRCTIVSLRLTAASNRNH